MTPGQAGMTLLELLVALAIFALVATAGYAGLEQGLAVQEHLQEQRRFWERLESVLVLLQRDLDQAMDRPGRNTVQPLPAFTGHGRRGMEGQLFEFTRGGVTSFADGPVSPYQRVDYRLRNGELFRTTWPRADRQVGDRGRESRLLEGVASVTVRYLGPGGDWLEGWGPAVGGEAGPVLPLALEFTLELEGRGDYRRLLHVGPPR